MKLSLRQNLARAILDNIEVKSWDMGSFSDDDLIVWALTILLQTKLDTLSKPSVVSEQSIYECLTETKGVVMTTDGDRRKFAKDVHKLITKG